MMVIIRAILVLMLLVLAVFEAKGESEVSKDARHITAVVCFCSALLVLAGFEV